MNAFLSRLIKEPGVVLRRLIECIFVWGRPSSKGDPRDAQLIVTQASASCQNGQPSKTNLALAHAAEMYHRRLGTPIFPQGEVASILLANGIKLVAATKTYDVPLLSAEYGNGSLDVAELQQNFCKMLGLTRVLLIAFSPHVWRARWIYERLGLEVIVPSDLPTMTFQRDLCQWRWQRAITAYPYELLARLWFLYRGYI